MTVRRSAYFRWRQDDGGLAAGHLGEEERGSRRDASPFPSPAAPPAPGEGGRGARQAHRASLQVYHVEVGTASHLGTSELH